jgi:sodium/proline symporter
MSDWLFMAYPAVIYTGGLLNAWIAISLIIGSFLSWHFIAPRLRIETERYNCFTLSSYFAERFNDKEGGIRMASAVMSLLFLTVYIAGGLKGIGFLLEALFGVPYSVGVIAAIAFIAFYTVIGGFIAAAWVDAFQALFLLGVIAIVPIVIAGAMPNLHAISEIAAQRSLTLSLMPHSWAEMTHIFFMCATWGLGYFSMPHILTKFMGISDVKEMHKSKYIGMTWQILVLTAATFIGLLGIAYFAQGLSNKELIFVEMVKITFNPLLAGFMLCAVLAAAISTIDAQVLVVASVLTEDIYKRQKGVPVSVAQLLWFYRASIIGICSLACLIALPATVTIQELVRYAWVGLTCSFGPIVITALYSKVVNRRGALSGIIVGGGISALWEFAVPMRLFGIKVPAALPAFGLGIITIYIVSWWTAERDAQRNIL